MQKYRIFNLIGLAVSPILSLISIFLILKWLIEINNGEQISKELIPTDIIVFFILFTIPAITVVTNLMSSNWLHRLVSFTCLVMTTSALFGLLFLLLSGRAYLQLR
jgi:hypothetical protein